MSKNSLNQYPFSSIIRQILVQEFAENADYIFERSTLISYLNRKTKSVDKGSKARGSFANIYALYVLIEDYINKGYATRKDIDYSVYEGAKFIDLFRRQRQLPFGAKLQNHALNHRLNSEFRKFFPISEIDPIIRDVEKQRYWIHEDLLKISVPHGNKHTIEFNLAHSIIKIIDEYIMQKKSSFENFIKICKEMSTLETKENELAVSFIQEQLNPNVDARIFEIVSYAVLKVKYSEDTIWIGEERESVTEKALVLYKTGRTNANDGGIDFVMKPIGRFFQVTETLDTTKYFLDIDKIQRFPITFVVKTELSSAEIKEAIRKKAISKFKIKTVIDSYMNSIEEIINVPALLSYLNGITQPELLQQILAEIAIQSKVEFNYVGE
ncbi:restriction endonuclease [Candidatus Tokpelaia sp.]|uniref:restriction endonuclease n=1 Tax=Candidatus Tokpelaia sp. TaxID=2233777 RepID=UPI00123BF70C|nr:restriction endonuclease [Candidatus Tokpelaia sp.]KAA6406123.1 restriction endonuclease [Candidatus Tokpelaia sp.]